MQILVKNKRAFFDYQIEKEYLSGIVLKGFEVKALKTSHSNIQDAVVSIDKQELWLYKPWNVLLALEVLVNKWGFIKIKLGIGKLKRKIEKKQVLKERAIKQQMDREIKNY